jgi:hypothetical protein
MIKTYFLYWTIIFALVNSSCTIELGQPAVETPTSPSTPLPPTVIATPNATSSLPTTQIPVTWGNLNLTGRLVYIIGAVEDNNYIVRIQSLDLVTGNIANVYEAPVNAWIYYVSVSPDNTQLVMSYSPPTRENPDIVQTLYTLPLDGSEPPSLLFKPPTPEDQYVQAEWSPDGKYIYYTQVNYRIPDDPNRVYPLFKIFRIAYPGGQPEAIAEKAYWPRLSPDSSRLVYISVDPLSFKNKLVLADANGGNAREVAVAGSWNPDIKDAPIFAPDGQSIILSAAARIQSHRPNWLEKVMGIGVAKADGTIPSEWWSVPMTGGELTQLTNIHSLGLFASISPDNQHIASFSQDGIFIMNPDGSELTSVINDVGGIAGTVSWIP